MDEVKDDELLVAFPSKPISYINRSCDKSLISDVSLTSVVGALNTSHTVINYGMS